METHEGLHWTTEFSVAKYESDEATEPYAVDHYTGNLGLNEGFNEIWQLVTGAGGVEFGATTLLEVGSDSTAAVATDTAIGTSLGSATVTGAPTFGSQSVTWVATFGAGTGTGAWAEWTIKNTGGKNLNRKVQSMGTKGAGASWTLTVTLTLGNP